MTDHLPSSTGGTGTVWRRPWRPGACCPCERRSQRASSHCQKPPGLWTRRACLTRVRPVGAERDRLATKLGRLAEAIAAGVRLTESRPMTAGWSRSCSSIRRTARFAMSIGISRLLAQRFAREGGTTYSHSGARGDPREEGQRAASRTAGRLGTRGPSLRQACLQAIGGPTRPYLERQVREPPSDAAVGLTPSRAWHRVHARDVDGLSA